MNKHFLWGAVGKSVMTLNRLAFPMKKDNGTIIRFDTSIGTANMGDYIIMHYCNKILDELFPAYQSIHISTHMMPTLEQKATVKQTKHKFVCGTNLLTSNIEHHWRWILPDGVRQKMNFSNVILLGVGWGEYQENCTDYSRMIYRTMLNSNLLHSVRDQYTLEKLQQVGFKNVINTGCPTTWALTPDFCQAIPTKKSKDVVATITDYRRDAEKDNEMLAILSRNYEHVYLWLQGEHDEEYLQTLNVPKNLTTISANMEAYEEILKKGGVDYVGTRLHAGIHALNHQIRSIIIAVDNRATEMGRDVHLPVLQRNDIADILEEKIHSDFATEIQIKMENIELFKAQFRR